MELQKISRCTKRCLKCKHHTTVMGMIFGEGNIACSYILDKYERRGCPAGDKCDKFDEGEMIKRFKPKKI